MTVLTTAPNGTYFTCDQCRNSNSHWHQAKAFDMDDMSYPDRLELAIQAANQHFNCRVGLDQIEKVDHTLAKQIRSQ